MDHVRDGRAEAEPVITADLDSADLAALVTLIRSEAAVTRPELVAASGLSRKVVSQRIEQALATELVAEGGLAPSRGGRQARTLRFRGDAGFVLGAVIEHGEIAAASLDLHGDVIALEQADWPAARGPEQTMRHLQQMLRTAAQRAGGGKPWAIAVGMPGPVDFSAGRLVHPPLLPEWDGFGPRAWLREQYDCPVWLDNASRLMALNAWAASPPPRADMLFVDVGTGVGAGLVFNGSVIRGASGGSGVIGHLRVTDDPAVICRCGKTGCLEAVASGWKMLDDATARAGESPVLTGILAERGALTLPDIGAAAAADDSLVLTMLADAARHISDVVANLVDFSNPGAVVLGGGVLHTGPVFLEVLTRTIRDRCSDLALRGLEIRSASLEHHREAVVGAGLLAIDSILNPTALSRWIGADGPHAHATELQRLSGA
ncbi:MAG TPA: ROK family protein [Microbacterium sp.]|nr:ROK family protein [Microbacterium sp.]